MGDDMSELDVFSDEPSHLPDPGPASMDASMRMPDGEVVRFAVHDDQIRMTIASADGMVTLTLTKQNADLFADLAAAAIRQVVKNARGF